MKEQVWSWRKWQYINIKISYSSNYWYQVIYDYTINKLLSLLTLFTIALADKRAIVMVPPKKGLVTFQNNRQEQTCLQCPEGRVGKKSAQFQLVKA